MNREFKIIGAGLDGAEAAWQLAKKIYQLSFMK